MILRRIRRRTVATFGAAAILAGTGTAFAYFLAQNTGTTSQDITVGSAPNLAVTLFPQCVTGTALTPGSSAETCSASTTPTTPTTSPSVSP
jgi:hypothetical protein